MPRGLSAVTVDLTAAAGPDELVRVCPDLSLVRVMPESGHPLAAARSFRWE